MGTAQRARASQSSRSFPAGPENFERRSRLKVAEGFSFLSVISYLAGLSSPGNIAGSSDGEWP